MARRDERQFISLLPCPAGPSTFGQPAAVEPFPRRVLAIEAGTYLLCLIDLCWSFDCLGDTLPDSRKLPVERGFKLSKLVVKRRATR